MRWFNAHLTFQVFVSAKRPKFSVSTTKLALAKSVGASGKSYLPSLQSKIVRVVNAAPDQTRLTKQELQSTLRVSHSSEPISTQNFTQSSSAVTDAPSCSPLHQLTISPLRHMSSPVSSASLDSDVSLVSLDTIAYN